MKSNTTIKKARAIRYLLIAVLGCLLFAAAGCNGCGKHDAPQTDAMLQGDSVTIETPWDSRLATETAADTFLIKTTVRSDTAGGADKAGAVYVDYGSAAVYITVAGSDASKACVCLTARQNGETAATRAYATAATEFEGVNHRIDLEVMWTGDAYYVGVNNVWTKIDAQTTAAQSDGTFDFFARSAHRFGVATTDTTAYHEKISSTTDISARRSEIEFPLTLDASEDVTAELSATTVLLGNPVRLTVTVADGTTRWIPSVTFLGAPLTGETVDGVCVYEFFPRAAGTVTVAVQRAYVVSGKFTYAEGLYKTDDRVTMKGALGEVDCDGGTYEAWLPTGDYAFSLVSERFADVVLTGTVVENGENTGKNVQFTELKFADGDVTDGGAYTVTESKQYKPFAGVTATDFVIKGNLHVYTGWRSSGLAMQGSDKTDILRIMILPMQNKLTILFLQDGLSGGGNPFIYGYYVTNTDWDPAIEENRYVNTVTLAVYDGQFYIAVQTGEGKHAKTSHIRVTKDTPLYSDNHTDVKLRDWLWNANEEKTFGITAWEDESEFPCTELSYTADAQAVEAAVAAMHGTVNATVKNGAEAATDERVTFADGAYTATAFIGETVTLYAHLQTEQAQRTGVKSVLYNGVEYSSCGVADGGKIAYTIPVTENGDITVEFDSVYKVTGTYAYKDGLYAAGDTVTVAGGDGTVNATNNTFEVWLPEGEQTVTLTSTRFADVSAVVDVATTGETEAGRVTFDTIKFTDGTTEKDIRHLPQSYDRKLFAGVTTVDFEISLNSTGLNRYVAAGPLMEHDGEYVSIFSTYTAWSDYAKIIFAVWNSDGAYSLYPMADMPVVRDRQITVICQNGVYYIKTEDTDNTAGHAIRYVTIDKNTASEESQGALPAWVFEPAVQKHIGIGTWGYNAGITDISYQAESAAIEKQLLTVTLSVAGDEHGTATLSGADGNNAFKTFAGSTAKLEISGVRAPYGVRIRYGNLTENDLAFDMDGDTVTYTVPVNESGAIEVEFVQAEHVSGRFAYAQGLYADGDTVTVISGSGAVGTVDTANKTYEIYLLTGAQTVTLRSARFADVSKSVTVTEGENTVADTLTFTEIKFGNDRGCTEGGNYTINGAAHIIPFAGVSGTAFAASITTDVPASGWETAGFTFTVNGKHVRVMLTRQWEGKARVVVIPESDDGTQYWAGYDFDTIDAGKHTLTLIATSEGVYYVKVDSGAFKRIDEASIAASVTDPESSRIPEKICDWLFAANTTKTVGLQNYGNKQTTVENISYTLNTDEYFATVTVSAGKGGTAAFAGGASSVKILKGETAELRVTPDNGYGIASVTYNDRTYSGRPDGDGAVFDIPVSADGTIEVTFGVPRKVTGSYDYADKYAGTGLTDGDTVTVISGSGAVGTVDTANKTYEIYLLTGAQTVTLRSARFADVSKSVTVTEGENTVADTLTFTEIKFGNDRGCTEGGNYTINGAAHIIPFAGVSGTAFAASITTDVPASGWETAGFTFTVNGKHVRVMLTRQWEGKARVVVIPESDDGTQYWAGYDFDTIDAGKHTLTLIATSEGVYYVKVDSGAFKRIDEASIAASVTDPESSRIPEKICDWLFAANTTKTVGLQNYGNKQTTVENISYTLNTDEYFATVTVSAGKGGTAAFAGGASSVKILKGETAELRVTPDTSNPDKRYSVKTVTYDGNTYTGVAGGNVMVYTIPVSKAGEITVAFAEAHKVTGTFQYKDGLYADGDTVTVAGASGEVTGNGYTLYLPAGEQTITLTSTRFADVSTTVTVSENGNNTVNTLTFTEIKFADGTATSNGSYNATKDLHYFAGAVAKDFAATATVTGGAKRGIVIGNPNAEWDTVSFHVENNGGKVRIAMGIYRDPWGANFETNVVFENTNTLTIVATGGKVYAKVNSSQWMQIHSQTLFPFLFNSKADKKLGIGRWNNDHSGTVENISYTLTATAPTDTALFADGTVPESGGGYLISGMTPRVFNDGYNNIDFMVTYTANYANNDPRRTACVTLQGTEGAVVYFLVTNESGKAAIQFNLNGWKGSNATWDYVTDTAYKSEGNTVTLIQKAGVYYVQINGGAWFTVTAETSTTHNWQIAADQMDNYQLGWLFQDGGVKTVGMCTWGDVTVTANGITYTTDAQTIADKVAQIGA